MTDHLEELVRRWNNLGSTFDASDDAGKTLPAYRSAIRDLREAIERHDAAPSSVISLPFPPSVNTITACVGGRKITSKKGREYRDAAISAIEAQADSRPAWTGRIAVRIELYPPCRRKRDVDNYSKAILDVLTHAGVWGDDDQVDRLCVFKMPADKRNPRALVTIRDAHLNQDKDKKHEKD